MGKGWILDHGNPADCIGSWNKSNMYYDQAEKSHELFDRRCLVLAGIAAHYRAILWWTVYRNRYLGNFDPVRMRSRVSAGIKSRQRLKRDQIQRQREKKALQ